jgi:hypothetical protein
MTLHELEKAIMDSRKIVTGTRFTIPETEVLEAFGETERDQLEHKLYDWAKPRMIRHLYMPAGRCYIFG